MEASEVDGVPKLSEVGEVPESYPVTRARRKSAQGPRLKLEHLTWGVLRSGSYILSHSFLVTSCIQKLLTKLFLTAPRAVVNGQRS